MLSAAGGEAQVNKRTSGLRRPKHGHDGEARSTGTVAGSTESSDAGSEAEDRVCN